MKNSVGKDKKKYKYVVFVVISGLKYFYLNRSRTTHQLRELENAFKCYHAICLDFIMVKNMINIAFLFNKKKIIKFCKNMFFVKNIYRKKNLKIILKKF